MWWICHRVAGLLAPHTANSRNARTDIKIRPPKNKNVIVTHGNGLPRATSATLLAAFWGMRVRIEHAQVGNLDSSLCEPRDSLKITTVRWTIPEIHSQSWTRDFRWYIAVFFKSRSASASEEAAITMNYPLLSKNCGKYDDTYFLCHGRCHPMGCVI